MSQPVHLHVIFLLMKASTLRRTIHDNFGHSYTEVLVYLVETGVLTWVQCVLFV